LLLSFENEFKNSKKKEKLVLKTSKKIKSCRSNIWTISRDFTESIVEKARDIPVKERTLQEIKLFMTMTFSLFLPTENLFIKNEILLCTQSHARGVDIGVLLQKVFPAEHEIASRRYSDDDEEFYVLFFKTLLKASPGKWSSESDVWMTELLPVWLFYTKDDPRALGAPISQSHSLW
jgi:hypothetical protein